MPEKPSVAMQGTASPEHEQFVLAQWTRLRSSDSLRGMEDLATLISANSDITTLLKRRKLVVKPTRLRAVK